MKSSALLETCLGPDGTPRFQNFGKPSESGNFSQKEPFQDGGPMVPSTRPACWKQGEDLQDLAHMSGLGAPTAKEMGQVGQLSSNALC